MHNRFTRKKLAILAGIVAAILLLGIVTAFALLGERLKEIAPDDSDVIGLVPAEYVESGTPEGEFVEAVAAPEETGTQETFAEETIPIRPGFEARDRNQVWRTRTRVDIFKLVYDEKGEATVVSKDGDRVFAPGTGNTYTFKFKNTGNVPIKYHMSVSAFIDPEDVYLPIQAKMNRYSGGFLAGGRDKWVDVLELDGIRDSATLNVNQYAYYRLDWEWPFERADENGSITAGDQYDTWLGNRAAGLRFLEDGTPVWSGEEDLTLTIIIEVVASVDYSTLPKTSDQFRLGMWITLLLISAMGLILVIAFRKTVFFTGFLPEGEGMLVSIDDGICALNSAGRFAFRKVERGRHRIQLKTADEQVISSEKIRIVSGNHSEGLQFEDGKIVLGKAIIALELHFDIHFQPDQSRWSAIDRHHRVYTPGGVKEPVKGENTTADGLKIDKHGKIYFSE